MRQCCLHLEVVVGSKAGRLRRLIDRFVADIWAGKMECLLIEVWQPVQWQCGTSALEKLTWVRQIHLAQVVINEVKKSGGVKQYQDRWCQRLEKSMMATTAYVEDRKLNLGEEYNASPQLNIDLVGEELREGKRAGGWVLNKNDLYALFGKCYSSKLCNV